MSADVTVLLKAAQSGDNEARDRLMSLVYDELKAIAARYVRKEEPGHTLGPSGVVHEAYLRLFGGEEARSYENRGHFLAVCARIMRNLLVDHARKRDAAKRGGTAQRVPLDEVLEDLKAQQFDCLDLNASLERLAVVNPRWSDVVTLRVFGGMTVAEVAEELNISERTVQADYRFALAVLQRELDKGGPQ